MRLIINLTTLLLFHLLLSLLVGRVSGQTAYTMDDLIVLGKEKNYFEFFQHANDIRPTERDHEWKELVVEMAQGFISQSLRNKMVDRDRFQLIEEIAQWPALSGEHLLQKSRIEYAQEYFAQCWEQDKSQRCQGQLNGHFASLSRPIDPLLGIFYGQLLEKYAPDDSWQMYQLATTSDMSRTLCGETAVQQALLQQASSLFAVARYPEEQRTKILALARPECWQQLNKILTSDLFSKEASKRQYAYWQLKWNNQLDSNQEDFFLVHFFLQTPLTGDTFNRAWNLMRAIGQDHQRREKILALLREQDPLPGKIFQTPSLQDRKVYVELLATNFPEYLELYSATCLKYLQGKAKFPRGNPTLECRDLFASAAGTNWILWEQQEALVKIFPPTTH